MLSSFISAVFSAHAYYYLFRVAFFIIHLYSREGVHNGFTLSVMNTDGGRSLLSLIIRIYVERLYRFVRISDVVLFSSICKMCFNFYTDRTTKRLACLSFSSRFAILFWLLPPRDNAKNGKNYIIPFDAYSYRDINKP